MSYVDYRIQLSPSWLLGPNGRTLSTALGNEENSIILSTNQGVLERYPDYAGIDSSGSSQALSYIGNDRNLFPVFDDNWNLDQTRLYFKSGFSYSAPGITLPWFPNTPYVQGTRVGAGGLVWSCSTAGTSGNNSPFPQNRLSTQTSGQVIKDGTAVWTLVTVAGQALPISGVYSSPTPTNRVLGPPSNGQSAYQTVPNAPGWYWAGTDTGLIDALVSAGFYGIDPLTQAVVPPRIYRNRDFGVATTTDARLNLVGANPYDTTATVTATCLATGTAGSSGTLSWQGGPVSPWAPNTDYVTGQAVSSTHGDVFFAAVGGHSGTLEPFPNSTPTPSTFPPTPGQGFPDNTVNWAFATFSPIPELIPVGPLGLAISGTWNTSDTATASISNNQPDGQTTHWARVWLVIPSGGGIHQPYLWGSGPGAFNGQWGRGPDGGTLPVTWGSSGIISGQSLYGLLFAIAQRWLPAHDLFIGAWFSPNLNTQLDSIPAPPWSEVTDVTIDGVIPSFYRYNAD